MVNQYVQTVEVAAPKRLLAMHYFGTVLILVALGLVLVAVFFSYYAFIAVAAVLAVSIALNQSYNSSAKEYEYAFNSVRIVISRKNQVGRQSRQLELLLEDIISFSPFCDVTDKNDLIYCGDVQDASVYAVTFKVDGGERRMLFSPDEYFLALYSDTTAENSKKETSVQA